MRSSREGLVCSLNLGTSDSDYSQWEWVGGEWVGDELVHRLRRRDRVKQGR